MAEREGLSLGQLLLTLDRTMVTLVEAPRGLDMPVGSVALVDIDDVRLGLAVGAGSADLFFLLGVSDAEAVGWIAEQVRGTDAGSKSPAARLRAPAAVFVKEPSPAAVKQAVALGTAVVAVEPRARWESLYKLVNHAFEHHGDRGDPRSDSGTDLFGLAQSIAERTHAMISIEDDQSHVLAYSASNEEADELRRLTILGRAGPPEHLEWIGQWGIFDALQASGDVVRIAERPELGLRPRLAVAIHLPATDARRPPPFAGTIWLQQGSAPLADDAEEVLRGGAVLAARIMSRLSAAPSTHTVLVQSLLGLGEDSPDIGAIAQELGIAVDGRVALVGFGAEGTSVPANVIALSASAFRADAQVASTGERVYVLLPKVGATSSLTSWVRGIVAALHRELGLTMRAVIAAPLSGLPPRPLPAPRWTACSTAPTGTRAPSVRSHRWTKRTPRCCSTRSSRMWPVRTDSSTRGSANCASRIRCWPKRWPPIWMASATSPRSRSGCTCTPTRFATGSAESRSCCRRRWAIRRIGWFWPSGCGRPNGARA